MADIPATGRYELKYVVPAAMRDTVVSVVANHARPDAHAQPLADGRLGYLVHSLYLDTVDLRDYFARLAGARVRNRVRVRTYGTAPDGQLVFLENKRKSGRWVVKHRAAVCTASEWCATRDRRPWTTLIGRARGRDAYAASVFGQLVDRGERSPVSVPGRVLSPSMQSSLVLLSMVAAMVMMVIGNNVARAFSLVGALAIVRFRTRLSNPWDISFVFFALAVGIGCGVMAWRVATLGTLVIGLAIVALFVIPLAGIRPGRLRMLRCDVATFEGIEDEMYRVLDRHVTRRWLVEARSLRFGEALSFRFRVVVADPCGTGALLRDLGGIEGVELVGLEVTEETAEPA